MSNKPQTVAHQRTYTRNDFAALRAFVQHVPPATIGRLYLGEDENGDPLTAAAVERRMRDMQTDLVALALEHGSPVLAEHLKASAKKHGSAKLTAVSLKMVEQAAQLAVAQPEAGHAVGMWFRPLIAVRLKSRQIHTLAELVAFCNARGGSWWRAVPRIGVGRARHIVAWLRRYEATIGLRVEADVDARDPLVAPDTTIVEVGGRAGVLAPLERMAVAHPLSGADGANRAALFPYIHAPNDLAAVRGYLYQYRDQPKTLRAYTKELERFLLWAVTVRHTPLSSLLVDDCEAYKDFLKNPDPSFVGPRAPRGSHRWRPFADGQLGGSSQRYAVRALRAAFAWLVDVRYLAGNPWTAVNDPPVVVRERKLRVERALPATLWEQIRAHATRQAAATADASAKRPTPPQWRVALALMLLMGDSGLRREEVVGAQRGALCPSPHAEPDQPVWQLTVVGKRNKERTVPVSPDTIDALRAHWLDRGEDFDAATGGPLVSPMRIPRTKLAQLKHGKSERQPYSPDGLNDLIEWARKKLIAELDNIDEQTRDALVSLSPHAFRHTFGTQAVANDVPLDVVQKVLGHASLQTTSIYVQAEQQRIMQETSRYFVRRAESKADE
ncbi:integrase [Burkholderia ubonensis]|uniref:Integrase n=1 Tax=Burkholderia ubonensis TaxID=101571 RepID=A0AB73FSP3_9BURK|nr:phage integrase family protein [Burkholderia ubonensis]KVK87724.1 integrase [Burkholderia ubonensis]KVL66250.1 integrase [Burkholderia ubonensis]KVM19982.1 integrase [Burkholderia ubonensis]KVM26869.1 integrase [Burkholderia ubonensis]